MAWLRGSSGRAVPGFAPQDARSKPRIGLPDRGPFGPMPSIAVAGTGREILLELARDTVEFLGVRRRVLLLGDVGPALGQVSIELQPLLETRLRIGFDGLRRAFRLADAAIDALV